MGIRESYRWHSKSPGDGGQRSLLSRRIFLGSAFAPLIQGAEAELSSFDLSLLDEPVVPGELFFVREHFPAPDTSSAGWKLAVTGAVEKPLEILLRRIVRPAAKGFAGYAGVRGESRSAAGWSAMRNGQAFRLQR